MRTAKWARVLGIVGAAVCAGAALAQSNPSYVSFSAVNPPDPGRTPLFSGADVIVGVVPDIWRSTGSSTFQGEYVRGYAIGTTSCNQGDVPLWWYTGSAPDPTRNRHPVIGMNLFRYVQVNGAGRFEQVAMSWLKHGFTALQQNACGFGCSATASTTLGVGCSDPYSASLNASQSRLGPRYQVQPLIGEFTYPVTHIPAAPAEYGRRILVASSDIRTDLNPGAYFWGEGQYVTQDDSAAGNGLNNSSFRRMTASGTTDATANLALTSSTRLRRYGIEAWRAESGAGNSVNNLVNIVYINLDRAVTPPPPPALSKKVERFVLGYQVTNLGGGMWDYHYALQNINAETAASSFSVPVDECADVPGGSIWYSQPPTHSGEPQDASPAWGNTRSPTSLRWGNTDGLWNPIWTAPEGTALTDPTTWNVNRGADTRNALRWGTMYSFGFRSNRPPVAGNVAMGLYKVTSPLTIYVPAMVPSGNPCRADLNCDGVVDFNDLLVFLNLYNALDPRADFNGDGVVDFNDFLEYLNIYNTPC
ncbi:MAG: hypothetical protein FJ255_04310 [Phycisphaerae bacterium]|nr:hypothetical protein [Phycisphaerae bacterium]